MHPAVDIWSLNHWTTREVPEQVFIECQLFVEGVLGIVENKKKENEQIVPHTMLAAFLCLI